jgi:hypothetical protein
MLARIPEILSPIFSKLYFSLSSETSPNRFSFDLNPYMSLLVVLLTLLTILSLRSLMAVLTAPSPFCLKSFTNFLTPFLILSIVCVIASVSYLTLILIEFNTLYTPDSPTYRWFNKYLPPVFFYIFCLIFDIYSYLSYPMLSYLEVV